MDHDCKLVQYREPTAESESYIEYYLFCQGLQLISIIYLYWVRQKKGRIELSTRLLRNWTIKVLIMTNCTYSIKTGWYTLYGIHTFTQLALRAKIKTMVLVLVIEGVIFQQKIVTQNGTNSNEIVETNCQTTNYTHSLTASGWEEVVYIINI